MGLTSIRNVRLFDGHKIYETASVTFDSTTGTITAVSQEATTSSSSDSDANIEVIDGAGHTLLPGLIDAHVHVNGYHLPEGAVHSEVLRSPLRCGVTTVCDMHCDPETIHSFKADIEADTHAARTAHTRVQFADLKSSLFGATISGGWPKPVVLAHNPPQEIVDNVATWPNVTLDTAHEFVRAHKANGADYIKLMQENCCSLALPTGSVPSATLELQTALVDAAHAEGLLVVGHATAREATEIVLRAGADGLTHTFMDQPPAEELVPLYRANNAFVIPTLVVLSSLSNEMQHEREWFADLAMEKLQVIDGVTRGCMVEYLGMNAETARIKHAFETVRFFRKHGIDVVAGTDSALGLKGTAVGPSLWMELKLYIEQCGMGVVEALTSATSLSAKRLGFGDRGVVEKGKRADLVLIKGNPTEKLEHLWNPGNGVAAVWRQGLRAV